LKSGECSSCTMGGACTAGAKIIGKRYILFKNRDLIWPDFLDSAVFDDTVFIVEGTNVRSGMTTGASFGVNRWNLSVANTTVLANNDGPYDTLTERMLRECEDIESAFNLVCTEIDAGFRYQWTNFILADTKQVAAIEIAAESTEIEMDRSMMVRTNHHLLLPTSEVLRSASAEAREAGGPLHTSQKRRQDASKALASARSTMDVMELLSSHSAGRGFDSICRHYPSNPRENPFQGSTVYSYILEVAWDAGADIRIYVARGNPCSSTYHDFPIIFSSSDEDKRDIVGKFP
jgi:hypothetical protein